MKITQEQRKKLFMEKRCHVCGKNTLHTHPNWMWLANPIPEFKEGELNKERQEMKILDKIKAKQKELDLLLNQNKQNKKRIRARWRGRFVNDNRNENFINPKPTELGLKELKKYNIQYFEECIPESKEMWWENPGISYTPEKCFCMICHSTNTDAWLQYGICPRFATCAKHVDFLLLGLNLKKNEISAYNRTS